MTTRTRRDMVKWSLGSGLVGGLMGMTMANEADAAERKPTALLLDPIYKQHDPGPGHPEQPARYDAVTRAVEGTGLAKSMFHVGVRAASEDEIALVHGRDYIDTVKREIAAGAHALSTGD